jgi:glyoxylase-like metal-dependent hydrolase (beta-lactamase superfamily II)
VNPPVNGDAVVRLRVGDIRLTRVPYFDIALDPSGVGLTAEEVRQVRWAPPTWATPDGQVLVGQDVWVVESGEHVVVVDPCGAADDFLRTGDGALLHQERVRAAMVDAGLPAERVDTVVLTHLDGIGMAAAVAPDGRWEPMFPNARIVMMQSELDWLAGEANVSGLAALRELLAQGAVAGVGARHEVAHGVELVHTGGHSPGHAVLHVRSDGSEAVLVGHLAVTPLHFEVGRRPEAHIDAPTAERSLDELLGHARADGTILIGPLWPSPGAVTVGSERDPRPVAATEHTS